MQLRADGNGIRLWARAGRRARPSEGGTETGLVNKEPGAEQRRNRTSPHTLSDATLVMVLLVSGSMLVVKAIR